MAQVESYKTITTAGEGFFKDKGSKFYAFVYPATTLEEVEAHLAECRKAYHDARHVCYAYRLEPDGGTFRANDDGEPSHSAGTPILNELKSFEVTFAVAMVVRYFGGTKLGVSGLIEAYKTATNEALKSAKIKEIHITRPLFIRYPYELTSEVNKLVHHHSLNITESVFLADCSQTIEIGIGEYEKIYEFFDNLGILDKIKIDEHE